ADIENLVWPSGPRDDVIPYQDAAAFTGEKITVEGTIVRTHNAGSAVFLNFSQERNEFTAVIFPDDCSKFPAPPEELFYGKLVRIEGIIEEYQGTPEIIITEPWQIEVALTSGQPVLADCQCPSPQAAQAPASSATAPAQKPADDSTPPAAATDEPSAGTETVTPASSGELIVSWQEAAAFEGQIVTVRGQVVDTYNSGKVVFLNFDRDYQHSFKVVIFPEAWPLFPAPPDEYYRDQTIKVTGQIKMYQNAPEIVVDQPQQIEIVE
ncbi:MAG: OB-fold nucleic acid binding domain-containing protein, partial [Chloroflexota bacterium]